MKIHLIDGTYELFRAFYAAERLKISSFGATKFLVRMLNAFVRAEHATHVAVAFDHVIESFRNDLYPGYKTGAGLPNDLVEQFALAEDASRALGLVTWPMVEFEADDALATAAAMHSTDERVEQIVVCSSDKDFAQCVRADRIVLYDRARKRWSNEDAVLDRFGVSPQSIPDWLALVGDTADCVPGVPGWGKQSASIVLRRYKSIEDIPVSATDWDVRLRHADRLAEALATHRLDALLFKKLTTLRLDVPLHETVDDLRCPGPDRELLTELAKRIGDERLVEEVCKPDGSA